MKTISATKARANWYDLIDEVASTGKRVVITNKGETKAVLISSEELESLEETNEILADKKLMRDLKQAEKDVKEGRVYDWEDVKKELGLDVPTKTGRKSQSTAKEPFKIR
jgi:antitoxin YefM